VRESFSFSGLCFDSNEGRGNAPSSFALFNGGAVHWRLGEAEDTQ
jgi:hypothetical protein